MAGRARGAQARANMTNLEKYRDNEQFNAMLQRIGVNRAGVNHIAADDFLSMDVLVNQYKSDIDEFSSYIKSVNKTNNNVRFSPVVTNRLIAVLHYFIQAVTCFHIIPDIELITRDSTPDLMDSYSMFKQFKDEDADDEVIIDLPTLKGHENWVHFRDKFLSNLSNIALEVTEPHSCMSSIARRGKLRRGTRDYLSNPRYSSTLGTYTMNK